MTAVHPPVTVAPEKRSLARNPAIALTQIARAFGEAAAHYDEFADLQRAVADSLLARIAVTTAATVLDLGCGTGYCSGKLRALFPSAQVVALDLAPPMLQATAAHQWPNVQLLCADMQALPLQPGVAGLAVSSLSLQWCADPRQVFAELARILQPGAQALLSTFGPATLHELRAAWRAADAHVHVNAFVEQAMLQQAARAAGVAATVERELHTRYYPSLRAIARELKGIGAHNMNHGRPGGLTSRAAFARAEQEFSKGLVPGQDIPVTWEIYYLDVRKPA